jgi:hypothetical protein
MILDGSTLVVWNQPRVAAKIGIPAGGCPATTDGLVEGAVNKYLGTEPITRAAADAVLAAAIATKENALTFLSPLTRTVDTISLTDIDGGTP